MRKLRSWLTSGPALGLAANILWGTSFLATKQTLLVWSPMLSTEIRFFFALLVMATLFPVLGFKIQVPKSRFEWFIVFAIGVTGFGFLYPLQLYGMTKISSGLSASIMLTSPIFVLLLASQFLEEKLSLEKIIAVLLGALGGAILVFPVNVLSLPIGSSAEVSREAVIGGAFMAFAAMALALSVILTRQLKGALNPQSLTFWSMLIGFLVILPLLAPEFEFQKLVPANGSLKLAIASMTYLVVACSVVAFILWNRAIGLSPAKELASAMHIKTPIAILLGCIFAGEPLSASIVLGASVVAIAVWLSQNEWVIAKFIFKKVTDVNDRI